MTYSTSLPQVRVTTSDPSDVDTELLIVPVFGEDDELTDLPQLDSALSGELGRARSRAEFRATAKTIFMTPFTDERWRSARVAVVGVDPAKGDRVNQLRIATAFAAREARRRRIEDVAFVLRGGVSQSRGAQAVAEGLLLGLFDDQRYKRTAGDLPPPLPVREAVVITAAEGASEAEGGAKKGVVLGTACNSARELANEPANVLTPEVFASRAREMLDGVGVEVEVLDEDGIRALGMGLLLGVAQGSVAPPRLVIMRYMPKDAPTDRVLGFVGKGVTFDSGGISIKPADGMDLMKRDMSGGAAVVGAVRAVAELQLPVRILGIVPMTENMPGNRATKPGDILTSASGKTVEVLNTDAEGRLILADALWYAQQQGATHLVDVATLTGSCVVALGHAASGLFGEPKEWVDQVRHAGRESGESLWPMPIFEEYREQLRSELADLANIGGRSAGACTAAAFLGAFVNGVPWAHVDIAGTAWVDDDRGHLVKGATGVMVRALAELACQSSSWQAEHDEVVMR